MGTAEDELTLHGPFRNEAVGINPGVDSRSAPEPAEDKEDYSEDMYLDWDQFMNDIRARIKDWDKKHGEFSRKEFGNFIYMRVRDSLKSSIIEEKFGGVFEDGVWGEDRWLNKVDSRLWDAFIDELCIMRLDLKRLSWDEIIEEWTRVYAENVYPERVYGTKFCSIWGLLSIIPNHLKSCQLIEKFNAEIKYDRQNDRMEITCDERLIEKAIEVFADKLNRLKPVFLKAKEAKADIESERYRMELAKANAANADEIRELRKELEAEREARQRAEAEIKRLLAEKRAAIEIGREEAEQAGKEGEDGVAPLADPESREREIRRIREEWSDRELEAESRILPLRKELLPLEAELSRCEYEYDRLYSAYQRELRKQCEEEDCPCWTPDEVSRMEGSTPLFEKFKEIRKKVWAGYSGETAAIKERREFLKRRCGELNEDIADQERALAIGKKEYEARLHVLGASLDPSSLCDASDLDDPLRDEDTAAPDYVLHGLPLGKIGCLAGPGGLGKTQIMTQLGFHIACGRDGMVKGGVIYIYGEDDRAVMSQRRAATLANLSPKLSENELADIKANFVTWHLDGIRVDLADEKSDGAQVFRRKLKLAERNLRRKGVRLRLIVLDTLSVFNGGKETLSEHVHAILGAMQRLCLETGASLVFLHHATKEAGASGNSGAGSVRGHSSLTNGVRWVTILSAMTEKQARALGVCEEERSRYVKMTFAKCNAIAPQEPAWFRMTDSGVFVPVDFGHGVAPKPLAAETPEIASLSPARPAGETPGTSPIVPNQTESANPRLTSQLPDSSGENIGQAAERPRSRKPRPVSGTGSSRLNRSFGG